MATTILYGRAPRAAYRVMMKHGGQWKLWTNYADYGAAELAAVGLIQGGKAIRCHIIEICKDGSRIVAEVGLVKKLGWPHGKAEVRKL